MTFISNPPSGYGVLPGSERDPARQAVRRAGAEPGEQLGVTLRLRRRQDAEPLPAGWSPEGRLADVEHVAHEEFRDRFGADPADVELVRAFARRCGLTVGDVDRTRRTVALHGTVGQMQQAFAVELSHYDSPRGAYRGREGPIHLPADIIFAVEGVFGLDNRPQSRPQYVIGPYRESEAQSATMPIAAPSASGKALTTLQVAKFYGFPEGSATGQTIGIVELGGGYRPADIEAFFSGLGLPAPEIATVGVDGAGNSPGTETDFEVALDIDVAASIGRGAKIVVYFAPNTEQGWVDVISTAVHDSVHQPSVLSISWDGAEPTFSRQAITALDATFAEAAALGITVFGASGDFGSSCGVGNLALVEYPASDPWVTACGGTQLAEAGESFREGTWNADGWATGGGVSNLFPLPQWQYPAGVPVSLTGGQPGRGVPDVAGNAAQASGYSITAAGTTVVTAGTSAVAPMYAGLVAVMNAALGRRIGYLNPALYSLAGTAAFRTCADGATNATGGAPGYAAVERWNACTGLGSINGAELLNGLRSLGY